MSAVLNLATGWLHFLALTVSLGAVACRWVLLRRGVFDGDDALAEARRTAARLGVFTGLALVVSFGLIFARQLAEFRDPFVPLWEDVGLLVRGTSWGTTWAIGAAAAFLLPPAFALAARGRSTGWVLATALALGLGVVPGLMGHANSGEMRALTLPADVLHVWAVGAWIGGLATLLTLEATRGAAPDGRTPSYLPDLVPRFSPMAITSVVVLGATGLLASWAHLPSVASLWTSSYGRLLMVKLALVAVVLALGAVNFRRLTPRLGEEAGRSAMRRAATIEFLVANVVLAITAIFVRTPPM
ncbi:MAG: hypothetical protein AMXMBFR53_15260 [Gemmatimonadota bacterium]